MTTTAYQSLGPSELLALMKLALGGSGPRAASREILLQNAIVTGAKRVWYHAAWRWRCLPYALTTTASQAYTTLPTNYRTHRVLRHLWFNDEPGSICRYTSPVLWSEAVRQASCEDGSTATGRPTACTVRLRTVSLADIFVMEWSPTPDAAYTLSGFEILKTLPDIDFTSSTSLFPESEFDLLWQAASFRAAIVGGLQLKGDTEYEKVMGVREFDELLSAAEDRWAIEDSQAVDTMVPDVDGLLNEFASGEGDVVDVPFDY